MQDDQRRQDWRSNQGNQGSQDDDQMGDYYSGSGRGMEARQFGGSGQQGGFSGSQGGYGGQQGGQQGGQSGGRSPQRRSSDFASAAAQTSI
jgi:hypothetical protein